MNSILTTFLYVIESSKSNHFTTLIIHSLMDGDSLTHFELASKLLSFELD